MASAGPGVDAPLKFFIADDSKPISDMLTELLSELGADDFYDKVKDLGKLTADLGELADARGPAGS